MHLYWALLKPPLTHRFFRRPEDLLKEGLGGCTLFIRHIAVDTRIAEVLGNELLGYSKFMGDIQFTDSPDQGTCTFSDAREEILRFAVTSKVEQYGDWERNTASTSDERAT